MPGYGRLAHDPTMNGWYIDICLSMSDVACKVIPLTIDTIHSFVSDNGWSF